MTGLRRAAQALDAEALLRAGRNRAVQVLIGAGFVVFLVYHLTRFRLSRVWPVAPVGDASILFDLSKSVFARGAYPDAPFPYSPSAVILFQSISFAGPAVFMFVWYLLMAAGLVIAIRGALAQERGDIRRAWPLIGVIAVIVAGSPIGWDLRNANSNLVYLGLVMAGYGLSATSPLLAGALVGLSVSLKLYSGLLIGWLMVNGPRRAFYAGLAVMILIWIALPILLYGLDGTARLYLGWREQVAQIADLAFHTRLAADKVTGPPLVTLHKAIVNLTGATFHSPITQVWLWVVRAVWVAALLWYAWRCRGCLLAALPSRAALADWVVLLIAPLPFSPWLEPYHAIPILVGTVLFSAIALDNRAGRGDRRIAVAGLAMLALFLVVRLPFDIRGLELLAQFLILVGTLGMLRPRLPRSSEAAQN